MRKKYGTVALCTLLILFSVSCTSKEMRRKEAETARNLGEGYMAQGNYTAALKELLEAEKLYPDDPILHNDLGYTYMAKGKLDLAVKHFKKALKLKPDYAAAKNHLGNAYLKKSDWDAAIACFKENIDNLFYATPQNSYLNLGIAYYYKKEYETSEKYLQECLNFYRDGLQRDATYVSALNVLGKLYIESGRLPEAEIVLQKAIRVAPQNAYLYFSLARAYVLSNEYQKAYRAYSRVVELEPETPIGQEANKILRQMEAQKN